MAVALTVAFASTDMKTVNQHFGSAESFVLYGISPDGYEMKEVMQFGELAQDGNEDKLVAKLEVLQDCAAVYVQAIGASAIGQLRTLGVQPMRVEAGTAIAPLLQGLVDEMNAGPTAWMAKAIKSQNPDQDRFEQMDEEDWSE